MKDVTLFIIQFYCIVGNVEKIQEIQKLKIQNLQEQKTEE